MPVSTLSKITVPLPGSSTSEGLLHPKLQYRFRVLLENFGITAPSTELTKQVMTVSRPNLDHDPIIIDVYNSRAYLVGKHTWNPIDLEVRDDASGNVQRLVGEQLQKQVNHYEQSSAVAGQDYKFNAKIEILDGGNGAHSPNILETWELVGCHIKSSNYNSLDYSASEVVKISLNIQYDNAIQTPIGSGVGADVPRPQGTMITGVS